MLNSHKSSGKTTTKTNQDAIAILKADHKHVKSLFDEFKKFEEAEKQAAEGEYDQLKQELVNAVCNQLKIHTTIEEEIFYPAARQALEEEGEDLLNEAEVEHASAKDLIAQIEEGQISDAMICAKFKVLSEYISHHVQEEETEMFPKLRKTRIDLKALGADLTERKEELMAELTEDKNTEEKSLSFWDRINPMNNNNVPMNG